MRFLREVALLGCGLMLLVTWYPAEVSASSISIQNQTPLIGNVVNDEKKLLEATVNLYCQIKVGGKNISMTGTGVLIDARGIILTNAHVAQYFLLNGEDSKLDADCSVRIGSPAKEKYSALVLYISKDWLATKAKKSTKESTKSTGEDDFALLYITKAKNNKLPTQFPYAPLSTANQIKKGNEVTVAGYPSGDLKYKEIRNKLTAKTATTTITNLQSFQSNTADLISLSRTKFASAGISGGPVMLSNTVVGIVVTRSTSKSKEGASLRALSTSYIDREITNETGLTLVTLYAGDLSVRAEETRASISTATLSAIEKSLRVLR